MRQLFIHAIQFLGIFVHQNIDGSIPRQLWVGADAYFKELIKTKRGLKRFWSEYQHAFDDPFRSYVTNEFAKKTGVETPHGGHVGLE
jgi:hypothetical protein